MRRLVTTAPVAALLLLAGPVLAGSATRAQPPGGGASLEAAGWHHAEWRGIPPAQFRALPGGGVAVQGEAQASFVWRPVPESAPACLSWRWRVDEGPPATDLARRGGDDKALAVAVGFAGWPPGTGAWQRTRHGLAQAVAGERPLPRSVLMYVWGGTGREPTFFETPYLAGLARMRVLRPADAPRGRWLPQRVDLAADCRAAFGGDPPPVQ